MVSLTLTVQRAANQKTAVENNKICRRMHSCHCDLFAQTLVSAALWHRMNSFMEQHITQAGVIF
jgi:hypothetical protein